MKKAVIYLRVSTTKQVEGASLDTQQKLCQDWASRNDVLVKKIYHDDGVSAKTLDRPAMKEMLAYLEENKGHIQVHAITAQDVICPPCNQESYTNSSYTCLLH